MFLSSYNSSEYSPLYVQYEDVFPDEKDLFLRNVYSVTSIHIETITRYAIRIPSKKRIYMIYLPQVSYVTIWNFCIKLRNSSNYYECTSNLTWMKLQSRLGVQFPLLLQCYYMPLYHISLSYFFMTAIIKSSCYPSFRTENIAYVN